MKGLLASNLISQLKPKEREYDVWDTRLIGFYLRVYPTGNMVYRCEYARGKRFTIGKTNVITPAQARDKAKLILSQAVMGIYPGSARKSQGLVTFGDFIKNDYRVWREAHRKSGKEDLRRLEINFFDEFGDCPLNEITVMRVEKWRANRINKGIKSSTVNREIVILKATLSKAIEWGLITEHPLKQLKLQKIDSAAKTRYLSIIETERLKSALRKRDEEFKKSRASANEWRLKRNYDLLPDLNNNYFIDYMEPMILLSLNTGIRQGELLNLQWNDVNLDQAVLTIAGESAKSGKTRHVPLNLIAIEALTKWKFQTKSEGLVFYNSKSGLALDNVRKAWTNILNVAEIKNFRWHDMRHHFASKLVMAGVDLNTVRELLGHADIKMTLRYAHLAPEHKASAVAKLV